MVKVRSWCGQTSDRGRLKTEQNIVATQTHHYSSVNTILLPNLILFQLRHLLTLCRWEEFVKWKNF